MSEELELAKQWLAKARNDSCAFPGGIVLDPREAYVVSEGCLP